MDAETGILVVVGIVFFLLGGWGIAWIIKKTKLVEKFSQDSRKRDKILNDPELLKKKIEETSRKLNPEAKGDLKIIDQGQEIHLGIKENDGKKMLDITKKDYVPPKATKEPGLKKDSKKAGSKGLKKAGLKKAG